MTYWKTGFGMALWVAISLPIFGCNPPTIYETKAGFQPRSQTYTVIRSEGADSKDPMPSPWRLIDKRQLHPALQTVVTAEVYDMVFYERLKDDYWGGAATYLWADPPGPARGEQSPQQRAERYVEKLSDTPLSVFLHGTSKDGCPCTFHSMQQTPFDHEGTVGYEILGYQRVRGKEGPDYGFYLSVGQRKNASYSKDLQAIVLMVAPSDRFRPALNAARRFARRIRWP